MRTYRNFLATAVLIVALSASTFAGDMLTGVATPTSTPPPAQPQTTQQADGTTQTSATAAGTSTTDAGVTLSVAEAAVSLVQAMLALL